jgi:hypothetical protein
MNEPDYSNLQITVNAISYLNYKWMKLFIFTDDWEYTLNFSVISTLFKFTNYCANLQIVKVTQY